MIVTISCILSCQHSTKLECFQVVSLMKIKLYIVFRLYFLIIIRVGAHIHSRSVYIFLGILHYAHVVCERIVGV